MALPLALRALQHRDFRLFWGGQLVSLIGTWMQSVGQAWLVLELTNSPFKLGLLSALQFAPMLFFAVVAGALTDRLPKRRLIIGTQLALLLQAFTLSALVWTGLVRYWHLAVLATLLGVVNTVDMPARQSFIAEMVSRESLMNAIALNSAVFNAARVVGPAVAGLLVARYGAALAFFLNGLSFIAVVAALVRIRAEGQPRPREGATMGGDIREGVAYALRTPRIALILALLMPVSLFVMNFNVLVPLFARDVLHQGAHGFGLLMAALGTGSLVGAVAVALAGRTRPRLRVIVVAAVVTTAATVAMAPVRSFHLAAAVLFLIGCGSIVFMTSCNTTLQMIAPDALRGRMMSLYTLVFAGVTPFGSFLMGTVAEHLGVSAAFLTAGGAGLVLVVAVLVVWRMVGPYSLGPPPSVVL
jgi:MFS family permease